MKLGGFVHALKALEPRLVDIVIVGGWAWFLYRKYLGGARKLPGEFTLDVDVVLPRPLLPGPDLYDLLKRADFEYEQSGDDTPPVTRYAWPSRQEAKVTVDFLTPARGAGSRPTLSAAGVVAQQLDAMEILLLDPLVLEISEGEGRGGFRGTVRVPRVGAFILQKTLILDKRRQKRMKDLFYVFDLAEQAGEIGRKIDSDLSLLRDRIGPESCATVPWRCERSAPIRPGQRSEE